MENLVCSKKQKRPDKKLNEPIQKVTQCPSHRLRKRGLEGPHRGVNFSCDPADYQLFNQMSHCSMASSTVYLAQHRPTGFFLCARLVNLDRSLTPIESFMHEVSVAEQLDHEHLLPFLQTFVVGQTLWMVMPCQGYGSCCDLLSMYFTYGLSEPIISLILYQVVQALVYLHKNGIIHRNIKPSHILLSSSGHAYLSGFRNAYRVKSSMKDHWRGTDIQPERRPVHEYPLYSTRSLYYYSPELLAQNLSGYGTQSDIYSLGITACELANGNAPFSSMCPAEMLHEKLAGTIPRLLDHTTVNFPEEEQEDEGPNPYKRDFSPAFHEFAEVCCHPDPECRPTAADLLNHPFFNTAKERPLQELPKLLNVSPLSANSPDLDPQTESLDIAALSLEDVEWAF